jgi:hypothetical protein
MILLPICRMFRPVGVTYWHERQVSTAEQRQQCAEILSYRTCIAAHSFTETGVYIALSDRRSILWRWHTRMRNVSQSITSCYYPTWKHSHSSHYATRNAPCFQSVSSTELSVAATNHCTPTPTVNTPAPRQTRPPHLLYIAIITGQICMLKALRPMAIYSRSVQRFAHRKLILILVSVLMYHRNCKIFSLYKYLIVYLSGFTWHTL